MFFFNTTNKLRFNNLFYIFFKLLNEVLLNELLIIKNLINYATLWRDFVYGLFLNAFNND